MNKTPATDWIISRGGKIEISVSPPLIKVSVKMPNRKREVMRIALSNFYASEDICAVIAKGFGYRKA